MPTGGVGAARGCGRTRVAVDERPPVGQRRPPRDAGTPSLFDDVTPGRSPAIGGCGLDTAQS